MNTNPQHPERRYFLDWLRILAFGLLVPYHVGMYYVSWGWHVKSATLYPAVEPFMRLSSPWRLGLLFFIAGAASHYLMQRGPGFVHARSRRLLWPLLFGMLVVVPPQAYFEVVTKFGYAGGYLDFMRLYLVGDGDFCRGGECLMLPTWNHLWFVAYLWVYSMLGWALLRQWPGATQGFGRWLARHASALTLLVVLALPLVLARALVGLFPSTHNLVWDWYNHAQYLWLYLLGLLVARDEFWVLACRYRRVALGLAIPALGLVLMYSQHYQLQSPPEALRWGQRALYGAVQWWCIVAICGFARQHLNFDHPWRRWLGAGVFCIYILHQTVIVLLTRVLQPWQLPAPVEGPLLIALTFALCLLGYAGARHVPGLRRLLGIAVDRSGQPQAPASAAAASLTSPRY